MFLCKVNIRFFFVILTMWDICAELSMKFWVTDGLGFTVYAAALMYDVVYDMMLSVKILG